MLQTRRAINAACVIGAILLSGTAFADPQYTGVFVARIGTSNADVQLERVQPELRSHTRALGMGGVATENVVPGERSSVRLPSGASVSLIVRGVDPNADPFGSFQIVKVGIKKGNRQFGGIASTIGHVRNKTVETVSFQPAPYRSGMMRLTITGQLAAGEYCATTPPSFQSPTPTAFCFGVD